MTSGVGAPDGAGVPGLPMLPRVLRAPRDPLGRTRRRLAVEHDVLLEHVPTRITGVVELAEHILDPRSAFAQRPEEPGADRIVVRHTALANARGERSVDVFEMYVADSRSRLARDLKRVRAAEGD